MNVLLFGIKKSFFQIRNKYNMHWLKIKGTDYERERKI